MALTAPTIHLNGTSKESLLESVVTARESCRAFMKDLGELYPNARDYYPQGADAIRKATEEHRRRFAALDAIHCELGDMAEAIVAQP